MIRQMVVDRTKKIGSQKNFTGSGAQTLEKGDKVLVKNTMRIKIRADGQRLIIPSKDNPRCSKYTFKAEI